MTRRSWTNVYLSFSLPVEDRERLDAALRACGTSLSLQFRRTLVECLVKAGVDPRHLDRPIDEMGSVDAYRPNGQHD
jgi:hypothetical protein